MFLEHTQHPHTGGRGSILPAALFKFHQFSDTLVYSSLSFPRHYQLSDCENICDMIRPLWQPDKAIP
jgi:hypothetical protein